jgi:GTPase SAR1 family protein
MPLEPSAARADYQRLRSDIGKILTLADSVIQAELSSNPGNAALANLGVRLKRTRQKWVDQRFTAAIMALVKSGKSTLLNAMLGAEFLPSNNVPETASIVRIRHDPRDEMGSLRVSTGSANVYRGAVVVREQLRQRNLDARQGFVHPKEEDLVLQARLLALANRELEGQEFEILDTPGPNEAGTEHLREMVEQLLVQVDVIVYILDYTKLKTDEEHQLFQKLVGLRPELLEQYDQRLFFVVNKMDRENRNGLRPGETGDYVRGLLTGEPYNLKLSAGRLSMVSAEYALLARQLLGGSASERVMQDFEKIAFGIEGPEGKTPDDYARNARKLLDRSGVEAFEQQVLGFLYAERGRILLQSWIGDADRYLSELENQFGLANDAISSDTAEAHRKLKQLKHRLDKIRGNLGNLDTVVKGFQSRMISLVSDQYKHFDTRMNAAIDAACQHDESARGEPLMKALRELFRAVLGKDHGSEEAAQVAIKNLRASLKERLDDQFDGFRLRLEVALHKEHRMLVGEINERIRALCRQIEEETRQAMDGVHLRPVELELEQATLVELHSETDEKVEKMIRKKSNLKNVTETSVKKGSWCGRDVRVEEVKVHDIPTYAVDVESMVKDLKDEIARNTNGTRGVTLMLIREKLVDSVKAAHATVEAYANSYVDTVEGEIKKAEKGKTEQEARKVVIGVQLEKVQSGLNQLDVCRSYLNQRGDAL